MWLLFALTAALLTSVLPIINKRLLAEAPVSLVAWGFNALSLPLLAAASLALSPLPQVDEIFWLGILASGVLNLVATLLSTQALKLGDASIVAPLLGFNPLFALLVGTAVLGETPTPQGIAGVLLILAGSYLLNVGAVRSGFFAPVLALLREPATVLALAAGFVWGVTPVTEKLAMWHSNPPDPPLVAFGSTAVMSVLLLPSAWPALSRLAANWKGFGAAAVIAGIAPVFGFTAIGLGLVGYVTAIFKLSAVFSVLWAALFLTEQEPGKRMAAAGVMVAGAVVMGL